jgi:5'-methylthioadenosine phosphorylase
MSKIGIIGGSGLYNLSLEHESEKDVETSFGKPSSKLKCGKLSGVDIVFISRHGLDHTIPPSKVNFRANIKSLQKEGCTHIIATTACGSLKREIDRGHLIILDQFIDFTRHREITFYDTFTPGEHGHTPMAEPFDSTLRNILSETCSDFGLTYHPKGTVVTIEGPRFSTKAESKMFASWGADVINMSIAPEAALANEAKIPYAAIAMSTDYDCLFDDVMPVTHEEVLKVFSDNVSKVISLITKALPKVQSLSQNKDISQDAHNNYEEEEETLEKTEVEKSFNLKDTIRTVPNWPKPGIMFRDITTLLQNPIAFDYSIELFAKKYKSYNLTKIAGIDSRGFIFGAALAREMKLPFIVVRKKGKLPFSTVSQEYELEYGTDTIQMHTDSVSPGDKVLIIDDLIATGGTAIAACQLVERLGGIVASVAFVINLPDLHGIDKLNKYDTYSLVEFEGE